MTAKCVKGDTVQNTCLLQKVIHTPSINFKLRHNTLTTNMTYSFSDQGESSRDTYNAMQLAQENRLQNYNPYTYKYTCMYNVYEVQYFNIIIDCNVLKFLLYQLSSQCGSRRDMSYQDSSSYHQNCQNTREIKSLKNRNVYKQLVFTHSS